MKTCSICGKELEENVNYCSNCGAPTKKTMIEEFSVSVDELAKRVKGLITEGNLRRIIIKNEEGKIMLEIPVTMGVIGVIVAPWMAALGVIAALANRCIIVIERYES